MAAQIIGYPPSNINYCPECGNANIEAETMWHQDGKLVCHECGLECYIIEGDNSHADN